MVVRTQYIYIYIHEILQFNILPGWGREKAFMSAEGLESADCRNKRGGYGPKPR